MQNPLQPSEACFILIRHFEGLRLDVYEDLSGFPTCGYGHKLLAHESYPHGITLEIAEHLLRNDVAIAANEVHTYINVDISQGVMDGLTDWTFNLGGSRLRDSTLRVLINSNRIDDASLELLRWNHASGKVCAGLTARREAERALFMC